MAYPRDSNNPLSECLNQKEQYDIYFSEPLQSSQCATPSPEEIQVQAFAVFTAGSPYSTVHCLDPKE